MLEEIPREQILATERQVLQAMCAGTPQGTVWDKGMLLLGSYPFQDVIHQLIFDILQEINTDLPEIIRKQLPSRLTQKGFPAVVFKNFSRPTTSPPLRRWSGCASCVSGRGAKSGRTPPYASAVCTNSPAWRR